MAAPTSSPAPDPMCQRQWRQASGTLAQGSPPCHCTAPDARATTSMTTAPEAKARENAALEVGCAASRAGTPLPGDCRGDPSPDRTVGSSEAASPLRWDMTFKFTLAGTCSTDNQSMHR